MQLSALADPIRLATLQDAGLLSDPPEGSFGHLPELAAKMLNAPISLITFVDASRELVESSTGLPEPWASRREIPLDHSYCKHLIPSAEPLLIEDARTHELTRNSPAIEALGAIAYAGIPLCTKEKQVLGGFCVIDRRPREWTRDEVEVLAELTHSIQRQIDQRVALRKEERIRAETARKFAQDLAAASRFRTLVENSLAGIYLLQGEEIVYANPRLKEIFGYAVDRDLSQLRVWDLVAEEDRARVMENIRRRMEGRAQSLQYDFRGQKKDGSAVDVEVLGSRTQVNGQPAIIGTLLDVTAQKRVEAALRESAERLRLVERATEDVIWEWNVHTGNVRWNEAGPKRFRYEPHEVGRSIEWHHRHIHPEDREEVVRSLQAVLSAVGEYWSAEYRFRRGDGQYATVLDRGIVRRDARGEPGRVVGVMMDVTERKREEEAQRFLSRASELLDSSLDQEVILTTLARHCVPAIGDYCTIDLVDENRGVRRVAATHVHPTREEQLLPGEATEPRRIPDQSPVNEVIRTGEILYLPECDDADLEKLGFGPRVREAIRGSDRASLIIAPLRVGDHTLGTIIVGTCSGRQYTLVDLMLVEDLARRTALAADHARLYQRATEAVRAREEILGVVSHDLRNPLNAIQMSAALLKDMGQERRAENQKWLEVIIRTTDRMSFLIADLLDISSIEAGRFAVEPAPQSMSDLVSDARDLLESMASEKDIRFESHVSEDVSRVRVDARQILRVISNLVGNAIKFTPGGGEVTLRVGKDGEEVLFTVSDTGPGIAKEHLPHIFEPHWQARPGERRGSGLGLSIARGIVEAHEGRIWVESTEGEGSTFFFTVPAENGSAVAGLAKSTRRRERDLTTTGEAADR